MFENDIRYSTVYVLHKPLFNFLADTTPTTLYVAKKRL